MGWQGQVRRRGELERIARHFGVSWQAITVWCWRDDDVYWVRLGAAEREHRVDRVTLEPRPLRTDRAS